MNKALILSCVLAFALGSGSAAAFSDNFDSYATGPLSVVSGGVWTTYLGTSTDALVTDQGLSVPNAMYQDGIDAPDVVAYWADLFAGSNTGALSYDFLVHEEGEDDIETYVLVGSGNAGALDINYSSAIGAFILDYGDSLGSATLHIWDIDGPVGGGDYGIAEMATGLALDVWHHVELRAAITVPDRTANAADDADGQFEVWLNAVQVLGPTNFGLDDPLGWNATEVYSLNAGGGNPEQNDYTLLDNFEAVPEPGFMLIAGLAVVALLRRKK